jgi:alkylated DNA repair dioxygenase AlkB
MKGIERKDFEGGLDMRVGYEVAHIDRDLAPVRADSGKSSKEPWTAVDSVHGFYHYPVLSPEDQQRLVSRIDEEQRWDPDFSRDRQWHAYKYEYDSDTLSRVGDGKLSDWLLDWARFIHERGWMSAVAEQVTVQKYSIGSYLGPHVDSRKCFGSEIVTFSLVSSAEFRLTNAKTRQHLRQTLEPGDVVVLQEDARNVWKHEILKHKKNKQQPAGGGAWRRLSVTFRGINPDRVR